MINANLLTYCRAKEWKMTIKNGGQLWVFQKGKQIVQWLPSKEIAKVNKGNEFPCSSYEHVKSVLVRIEEQ